MATFIEPNKKADEFAHTVIGAAIEVHRHLGPGFLDLGDIHQTQMISYLKTTGLALGLLLNFNVSILKNGIQRVVFTNKKNAPSPSAPNQDSTWRSLRLGG